MDCTILLCSCKLHLFTNILEQYRIVSVDYEAIICASVIIFLHTTFSLKFLRIFYVYLKFFLYIYIIYNQLYIINNIYNYIYI